VAAEHLALLARGGGGPVTLGGAGVRALLDMARHNAGEALGDELAEPLRAWDQHLPAIERAARPVTTDNRLHAWEWLRTPDGRIFKTDAVDHHVGHDLVGAQDIGWDIAGAVVELDLDATEQAALLEAVARAAGRADLERTRAFYTTVYLAFQLGAFTLAAAACGESERAEQARLGAARDRYAALLRRTLTTRR
jgi:hypothetical protein